MPHRFGRAEDARRSECRIRVTGGRVGSGELPDRGNCVPSNAAGETVVRQPRHAGQDGEHVPGMGRLGDLRFGQAKACRRDVQRCQVVAAERAVGDLCRGHLDDAIDGPVRCEPNDAGSIPAGVPQTAFGIDRRPVGNAPVEARELALAGDRAGVDVEVVGEDRAGRRVAEIHGPAVRAPADGVGNAEPALERMHRQVRVDAVQRAGTAGKRDRLAARCDVVLHRAQPEPAPGIRRAVVRPVEGLHGLGHDNPDETGIAGVEDIQPAVRGDQAAGIVPDADDRDDHLVHVPTVELAGPGTKPQKAGGHGHVGPPQRPARAVPEYSLAKRAPARDGNLRDVAHLSLLRR